jgi:L,D-peptidoglycan transpeptidase YkuD (ErfK/YbiS/YcfS/YnhG family)
MKTPQIITITPGKKPYYELKLYELVDDQYQLTYSTKARCGRNGLSRERHNGDGTTPIGTFRLLFAFGKKGIEKLPCKMAYKVISEDAYWAGDDWPEPNRYVLTDHPLGKDYEHLKDYEDLQYKYAYALDFNYDPFVKGVGNAIFFHCLGKGDTAGCVACDEKDMKYFITHLYDCVMIISDHEMGL